MKSIAGSALTRTRPEEELRAIAARMVEAQDEERRAIALELHDLVSQRVAFVCIGLERMHATLAGSTAGHELERMVAALREVANEVRSLSHAMHPSLLQLAGLDAALRSHCSELRELVRLEVDIAANALPRLPGDVSLCLYRVAQAALANVVAHAGVRRARLAAYAYPGMAVLEVRDHGRGFDPDALRPGLGLLGMRERLHGVRGTLTVETWPGGGTVVRASVPLGPDAPPLLADASAPARTDKAVQGTAPLRH